MPQFVLLFIVVVGLALFVINRAKAKKMLDKKEELEQVKEDIALNDIDSDIVDLKVVLSKSKKDVKLKQESIKNEDD